MTLINKIKKTFGIKISQAIYVATWSPPPTPPPMSYDKWREANEATELDFVDNDIKNFVWGDQVQPRSQAHQYGPSAVTWIQAGVATQMQIARRLTELVKIKTAIEFLNRTWCALPPSFGGHMDSRAGLLIESE